MCRLCGPCDHSRSTKLKCPKHPLYGKDTRSAGSTTPSNDAMRPSESKESSQRVATDDAMRKWLQFAFVTGSSPLLLLFLIFCRLYILFLNGYLLLLNILGGKALVESLCEGIPATNADEDSLARLHAEFEILESVENEQPQSDDESDCSE